MFLIQRALRPDTQSPRFYKTIASVTGDKTTAVKRCIQIASDYADSLPNNARLDICGIDEVAAFIGLYQQDSFRILEVA